MSVLRERAHRRRAVLFTGLLSAFVVAIASVGVAAVPASAAAGASISGAITLPDGSSMTSGQVRALQLDSTGDTNGHSWPVDVALDGTFHIDGVDPGDYKISIEPAARTYLQEYWPDAVGLGDADIVTVADGDSVTGIDGQVDPAGVISGTITDFDGVTPSAGGRAILSYIADDGEPSSAPSWIVDADAEGRYTLDGLTPGRYALRFTPAILSGRRAHVVTWDGTTKGYIDVGRSQARTAIDASTWYITDVSGVVTTALGQPEPNGKVELRYESGETHDGYTDANGRYLFFGMHPGRATLRFETVGRADSTTWLGGGRTLSAATWIDLNANTVDAPQQLGPLTIAKPLASVFGVAQVGRMLEADTAGGDADTTVAYQWLAGGTPVAGATKRTFTPTAAHLGTKISVRVTWTQPGYATEVRTSAATRAVIAGVLTASTPKISGTIAVGSRVTAKPGTWTSSVRFSYQWYANGRPISGATNATFAIGKAQHKSALSVKVTGRKAGYTTVAKNSVSTPRVVTAPTPKVVGSVKVGATVTAAAGDWTSGLKLAFRWYADGVAISGATRSTFTVSSAQRGSALTVKVIGSARGYATVAKTSKATLRVPRVAIPTVTGRTYATLRLTAKPGTWSTGTSFSYQWYADGRAISGATSSALTLAERHRGARITVKVTGRKSGYTTVSQTSAATAAVKSGKSSPASKDNCPSAYPIKGNQTTRHTTDWIYHVPGGQYYAVTDPEECFVSARAAELAGYRPSKR